MQMNRASGNHEIIPKVQIFKSSQSSKWGEKEQGWKSIQRNNGWKLPRLGGKTKQNQPGDLGSWVNPR